MIFVDFLTGTKHINTACGKMQVY